MLGLARSHARSPLGTGVGGIKPFYRGAKVTVIKSYALIRRRRMSKEQKSNKETKKPKKDAQAKENKKKKDPKRYDS